MKDLGKPGVCPKEHDFAVTERLNMVTRKEA
jgi:hypothetical protein